MLLRTLPWSLAGHAALLGALLLFGGSVAPPRPEPRSVIRVRLGGGPPGRTAARHGAASVRPTVAAPAPPQPQAGTRRAPQAEKKPAPRRSTESPRPVAKGLAPDRPADKPANAGLVGTPGAAGARPEGGLNAGLDGGGPGRGAAAGGTDQPFPFDWYLTLVEGHISRNWNPAQLGLGSRTERSCVVHFTIEEGGGISGATVQEASGIALFDREALRAVTAANPLPPLPRGFGAGRLGVSFIFTLRTDQ